ncbi:MAG: diiron oxygenase, partial [Lapillicoccus sp.]
VNQQVYAAAGLDPLRAVEAARTNTHRASMMRTSSAHLMEFLGECGLLTAPARALYARLHML